MQYFVQFDVHQPVDMSREELFTIWLEEPRAAQGAVDAGAVTNLWKVVGQRGVFAVLDVPDRASLDQALESLPMIQSSAARWTRALMRSGLTANGPKSCASQLRASNAEIYFVE